MNLSSAHKTQWSCIGLNHISYPQYSNYEVEEVVVVGGGLVVWGEGMVPTLV